jgi:hypothetical protein
VGGSHYKDFAIQPAEFIHRNGIGFLAGNIIKYVCRFKAKNGAQDLEKAMHYLQLLTELEYETKFDWVRVCRRCGELAGDAHACGVGS